MEKYIDDTDVYILDLGLQIYQYNGQGANKDERVRVSDHGHHWLQHSSLLWMYIMVQKDLLVSLFYHYFLKQVFVERYIYLLEKSSYVYIYSGNWA